MKKMTNCFAILLISISLISCGNGTTQQADEVINETVNENSKKINPFDCNELKAVGELKQGMTFEQVVAILGEPDEKGEVDTYEDGSAQILNYKSQGVIIEMHAWDNDPLTVSSIFVTEPCTLKTARGIGIGSTKAEIEDAFEGHEYEGVSTDDLIPICSEPSFYNFELTNGKVSRIVIAARLN